jgi:uncharacterized membrane protein
MSDATSGQGRQPPVPSAEPTTPRTVRGQPLPDASVTPIVHYYRAEMSRGDTWRVRMDATTNWAIGTAAAVLSVAFSRPEMPHVIIPLGGLIILLLMCIEGRRYRFYDVWRSRTRLLEAHMIVPFLLPEHALLQGRWREQLAEDLILPSYKMSIWRATGARLRRNYVWIFMVLLVCWIVRVMSLARAKGEEYIFQGHVESFEGFMQALRFGVIPPWAVLTVVTAFYAFILGWALVAGRVEDPDAFVYKRLRNRRSLWPL